MQLVAFSVTERQTPHKKNIYSRICLVLLALLWFQSQPTIAIPKAPSRSPKTLIRMAALPPDPRVKGNPQYNQEAVIAAVTDFYQFLTKMPYIDASEVLYPPTGGWPNINEENFAALGKSKKVIQLLKHLPYIKMAGHEYVVAPDTHPCDYRGKTFQSGLTKESAGFYIPVGCDFPPWVVPLTYGKRDGSYLMLDTTDGKFRANADHVSRRPLALGVTGSSKRPVPDFWVA